MKALSRLFAVLVAALAGPIMGVGALAQDDTDNTEVKVEVHSGSFNVMVEVGQFDAVQPKNTSNGSLTIVVEDERASGGLWSVRAKTTPFTGDETSAVFNSLLTWTPSEITPTGAASTPNGTIMIGQSIETVLSSLKFEQGTVSASGPVAIEVPEYAVGTIPLPSDTYTATITVELYGGDPIGG